MKLFIITVITVVLASPAFAQSVSFDSALHGAGSSPGVTITAPLTDGGLVDLTGHIGRVDLESDVRGDATAVASQIGIRFNAPEVFRVRPYINTGIEQIGGSVGYDDVLALNLQPGIDVRVSWTRGGSDSRRPLSGPCICFERVESLLGQDTAPSSTCSDAGNDIGTEDSTVSCLAW